MLSCITRMPCHSRPGQAYIHADIPLYYMYILHRAGASSSSNIRQAAYSKVYEWKLVEVLNIL